MSSWKTVPSFFPEPEDLDSETWYHLQEGYCVSEYETKPSGRMYKKVRADGGQTTGNLICYLGFTHWWKKWEIARFLCFRYWRRKRG